MKRVLATVALLLAGAAHATSSTYTFELLSTDGTPFAAGQLVHTELEPGVFVDSIQPFFIWCDRTDFPVYWPDDGSPPQISYAAHEVIYQAFGWLDLDLQVMGTTWQYHRYTTGLRPDEADFVDQTFGGTTVVSQPLAVAAVPEPSAWAAMLLGLSAIGLAIRRRAGETRMSDLPGAARARRP